MVKGRVLDQQAIREFGPFRLDPAERLLMRDDHPVALTPKAFDLLLYLVDRAGRLAPDGRLLMVEVKPGAGVVPPPPADVRLIVNWSEHLRARVPAR